MAVENDIDFTVNGVAYTAGVSSLRRGMYCWTNDLDEESEEFYPTVAEAQQAAIEWESDRAERRYIAYRNKLDAIAEEQHNDSLRRPL